MKLLLDTHVWVWSLMDPGRLKPKIRRALESPKSELWLSPITTWEFLVLVEKGRLRLDVDPDEWLADAAKAAPTREAPLTHEIARESRRVKLAHGDPADRFLAATARVLGLKLVTADARLIAAREIPTLANR